jgi:hypothetical protein
MHISRKAVSEGQPFSATTGFDSGEWFQGIVSIVPMHLQTHNVLTGRGEFCNAGE